MIAIATSDVYNAAAMLCAASMIPEPQVEVVQSDPVPVGKVRAVDWIAVSTCAGVSEGFIDNSREIMPVTCGAAMLVP